MSTLLINGRIAELPPGAPSPGPWVPVSDLPTLTGWELKPEGACLGDLCVPLPRGRESEFVSDGWFSVAALAGHLSQPIAHDSATDTFAVGEAAQDRRAALESLEAPNFTLPDYLGKEHQLEDYRGKKVFLVSWASW